METTHENSRFRSELLGKTRVLNHALLARLKLQFLPSATATPPKFTLNSSPLKNQERDYFLNQPKIQPIDTQPLITIQNGNSDFVQELKKINQLSFFDSFNCIDKVAVTGNNARQELQNLFVTVQHHTIVDVFLCLSFANCLFTGELRLALALVRLWWGGDGNKPFIRRIPSAVVTAVLNLPAALYLGLITQTSLPVRKVL